MMFQCLFRTSNQWLQVEKQMWPSITKWGSLGGVSIFRFTIHWNKQDFLYILMEVLITLQYFYQKLQHVEHQYMCCDLAGSVGSQEHWLWDTARKGDALSLVFYCFENLSIALTLEPLVRFRCFFKQNVPLLMRTSIK